MLDPIWESYSDEELIAEYYAHLYSFSKAAKDDFLNVLKGHDDKIFDWLDEQVKKNQNELQAKSDSMEDEISFDPSSLGD